MTKMTNELPDRSWGLVRGKLVGFVARRVESSDAAEDIVQDVFERLQRSEPGSITNPQAWLYRAARNATIDHYRTRRVTEPLEATQDLADLAGDDGPNSATRELAACLRPLVRQLPAKYRTALTLVDLDGRTQREAARIEGVSTSGMKSRVQRGRSKLGELLTACCAVTTDTGGSISDYEGSTGDCPCQTASAVPMTAPPSG